MTLERQHRSWVTRAPPWLTPRPNAPWDQDQTREALNDVSKSSKSRTWEFVFAIGLVAGLVASGIGFWWWVTSSREDNERAYQAAISTAYLPEGVEAAWLVFLDQRLRERVTTSFGAFAIYVPSLDYRYFISNTMPYEIHCDPLWGVTIGFGTGEHKDDVELFLFANDVDAPALPVHEESIAAKKLSNLLCDKAAAYMEGLLGKGF